MTLTESLRLVQDLLALTPDDRQAVITFVTAMATPVSTFPRTTPTSDRFGVTISDRLTISEAQLIELGEFIGAIRSVRQRLSLPLREAKLVCDEYRDALYAAGWNNPKWPEPHR